MTFTTPQSDTNRKVIQPFGELTKEKGIVGKAKKTSDDVMAENFGHLSPHSSSCSSQSIIKMAYGITKLCMRRD